MDAANEVIANEESPVFVSNVDSPKERKTDKPKKRKRVVNKRRTNAVFGYDVNPIDRIVLSQSGPSFPTFIRKVELKTMAAVAAYNDRFPRFRSSVFYVLANLNRANRVDGLKAFSELCNLHIDEAMGELSAEIVRVTQFAKSSKIALPTLDYPKPGEVDALIGDPLHAKMIDVFEKLDTLIQIIDACRIIGLMSIQEAINQTNYWKHVATRPSKNIERVLSSLRLDRAREEGDKIRTILLGHIAKTKSAAVETNQTSPKAVAVKAAIAIED